MINTTDTSNYPGLKQLDKFLVTNDAFIAGGIFKNLFTNTPFKDVDVFFPTAEAHAEAVEYGEANLEKVYSNDKVDCYRLDGARVEFIKHRFGSPETVLADFDFTITKFAYGFNHVDGEATPYVVMHEKFFEHLMLRRLVVDGNIPFPVNTWERTYKYRDQGYNLCRGSKVTILEHIINGAGAEDIPGQLSQSLYRGID